MNIMWSLEKNVGFFYIFNTADDMQSSDLASLHKSIKAKRQEARLCPSCLADPSDVTCKGGGY